MAVVNEFFILISASSYTSAFPSEIVMTPTEKDQHTRAEFYSSKPLAKYIMVNGVPKSNHDFRDMVASGISEDLTTEKGLKLIAVLGQVTFLRHSQQINIMDKSNGNIIASITR